MQKRDNATQDIADLHRKEQSAEDSSIEHELQDVSVPGKIVLGSNDDPTESEAALLSTEVAAGKKVKVEQSQSAKDSSKQFLPPGFKNILENSDNGQALDEPVRHEMESGMGTDLRDVKIHTDGNAGQLNQMIGSGAFALGKDVYFGEQNYNPASALGKHLLAHELVHTQQSNGNVVRMANDEELERLRQHHSTSGTTDDKAKLKAEKQLELDTFINNEGGAQSDKAQKDEFKRQRGVVIEKEQLADLDERLKKIRNQYLNKLRNAGVGPDQVVDPFGPLNALGVDRPKYLKNLTSLFELYNLHVDQYNSFNEEIKADRAKLMEKNADMQKMQTEYGLSLKGVQPGKTKDTRTAGERAEELLKWAEAEARTSTLDYTVLVRDKEKKGRDEKKGDKRNEYDSFVSAQKIIRDDLDGDKTRLSVADLQLVLRYFLKGTLSDDDKFTLVAFLSKHINDANLELVFGYSEKTTSQLIDPADIIKALDTYDLLNYERRPYFEKKSKGGELFLEMEKVRSTLVVRLKDMKAAKDANDALLKKGSLNKFNTNFTGKQESYFPFKGGSSGSSFSLTNTQQTPKSSFLSGNNSFGSSFMRNVSQETPKSYFPQVMFPDWRHLQATKLQDAINKYDATSPTPPITILQGPAWQYYQSVYPFGAPLSETQFYAEYNTKAEIQFLLNTTVNPAELSGSKFRTTTDSWTELGEQLLSVALKTGIDYLQLKERADYFKATDPAGYYGALTTLGVTGLVLSIVDKVTHPDASWGQTLLPLGQLGLSGSYPLLDRKIPKYGETVANKLSFNWDIKRDDAPPGVGLFNTLYNPGNTHPFFKGKDSVPGLFLNTGLTGSSATTFGDKEKEKLSYNFKLTIHYAPGSEGTTASDETILGRMGMFFQQPFDSDQASTLMNNSPQKDMVNMWGRGGVSYKRNWFLTSGSVGGGTYNVGGAGNEKMNAVDYKFNAGVDKLKLGDFTVGGSAGVSGSYADSPTTDPSVSATFSAKANVEWKSFTFTFSFDDDLTKNELYNKYKAELEYSGLGRYSPLVLKAVFMNMYNQGQDQMVYTGGLALGYKFGTGGKGFKQKYKLR